MNIEELNALVENAYEVGLSYEEPLAREYAKAFVRASLEASKKFEATAVTAAGFVPPPNDTLVSPMTDEEKASVNRVRDEAAEAITNALAAIGLLAISAAFLEAIAQRGQLNWEQELDKIVRDTVSKGLAEGWSADETALALQEQFTEASPYTVKMLAETELTTLVNQRSLEAAQKNFRDRSDPVYKTWETMKDNRVRAAHAATQGQTVPINQPFNVGGYQMMYPGDPSAPLQLVARCRCRMTYTESLTASAADPWYAIEADPWYEDQLVASASALEAALAQNPTRIILEYDPPQKGEEVTEADLNSDNSTQFEREVAYQIKFFYGHGYWSGRQMTGGPPLPDMDHVMRLAVLVATRPETPVAKTTRDRLEQQGLLY